MVIPNLLELSTGFSQNNFVSCKSSQTLIGLRIANATKISCNVVLVKERADRQHDCFIIVQTIDL